MGHLSIDPNFKVCALLGYPVGHSLSPALHNAGFEALGLPLVYVAHAVPAENLGQAIAGARALGYRGLSVTIPHKVAAMEFVDEVDGTARAIGCINTVVNENGKLLGFNCDGQGAINALRDANADPKGRRVTVLGSGGAARAISMTLGLEARPAQLNILSVQPQELEQLASDVSGRSSFGVSAQALNDKNLERAVEDSEILINCTPVGMHPDSEKSLVPPGLLRKDLTVFDVIYNPRRTKLLRDAASVGAKVIEGMEMFLGQALVQFQLWTGKPAPANILRRVLEERL